MHKSGKLRFVAIIIGSLIAAAALILGGFLLVGRFSKASDAPPQGVTVTNITQNSATITWTTGADVEGVVEYGTTQSSLGLFALEGQKSTSHTVDLTLLSPDTTYYFQIKSGEKDFSNGGVPWSFSTTSSDATTPVTDPATIEPTTAPVESTTPELSTCTETDCEAMKAKFGKGCTTQDYFICLRKPTTNP